MSEAQNCNHDCGSCTANCDSRVPDKKSFEEKLADCPFARCNSGYLVNLAQVRELRQSTVQVGPCELQVSRPKRKGFLAALTDYIGGEGS